VLEAARALFAAEGADTQMDDVAARAGVGLGTVYRHFPTKAALAAELVAEGLARFAQHGTDALNSAASPWDALVTTVSQNLELAERDAGTRYAVTQVSGATWEAVEPARAKLHEVYSQLISAAQAEKTLRADFGSEDLEMVMRGICTSMDSGQAGASWRRHLGYVLDGLRSPGGRRQAELRS